MADLAALAAQVRDAALASVQNDRGVRVEDYLATLAAAAGEAALAAAGFDVENHQLPVGSALFYDPVNAVLTGDPVDVRRPGTVWSVLAATGPLPDPTSLYVHVASTVGDAEWGLVSTTVPADNVPFVMPLRAAFELRPTVLAVELAAGATAAHRHVLVTTALVQAIGQTAGAVDHGIAVQLACEVLFGMAKMAPMTTGTMDAR